MPNNRTPDNVHRLKGTWRADRHARDSIPVIPMDPKPPAGLTPPEVEAWNELAVSCKAYLAQSDRAYLEVAARLMAASRAGTTKAAHETLLMKALDKIGATPAGRARLHPINASAGPSNPFEELGKP